MSGDIKVSKSFDRTTKHKEIAGAIEAVLMVVIAAALFGLTLYSYLYLF